MPFIAALILCASLAAPPDNGMLLHVSFDHDRRADFAVGDDLPSKGRYGYLDYTAGGGTLVPGVFGQALTGRARLGYYDARGNFNPRRGTIAFFLKQRNKPYGFEPLVVSSVDNYYWLRYLRLEAKPPGVLVTSIANEIYRPRTLYRTNEASALKEDTWQHVAIVWDETRGYTTYLDGEVHASNWGEHTWLSHGLDADCFWLRPDDDVAYDELYVFDRPLTQHQVQTLMRDNVPPSTLPGVTFDAQHRLAELSWVKLDALPHVSRVKQVTPLRARAVKGECNLAIDGKLGGGFPALYGYKFAEGNGLHVELPGMPGAFDYVTIEGHFTGDIYHDYTLLPDGRRPDHRIIAEQFMHRLTLPQAHDGQWISFFRYAPEDLTTAPDKEQLLTGRINELGFFKLDEANVEGMTETVYAIGTASVDDNLTQYPPGDRAAFAVGDKPVARRVEALRYHHILLPAADTPRALSALRLHLDGDSSAGNAVRIELHDPNLPARRLMAFDCAVDALPFELTIDITDRIVPPGKTVWLTLCFRDEVTLRDSAVTWFAGDLEKAIDEHFAADLPLVLSRFAELASPRPWGATKVPEDELPAYYRLAGELFIPLAQLRDLRPDHPTVRALWAWTHKDTVDTSPIEPKPVAGHDNAPHWALLQRELMDRCGDVFRWWIDNRQAPTGEFGDDLNDDTDFMQDAVRYAMFRDPGGRIERAALAVADACVDTGTLTAGVSTLPTDPLHAYENGTNALAVAALLRYGDPVRLGQLMEAARTIEEKYTALDVHGRRRFRSAYFGYNEIREEGHYGVDTFSSGLFAHPALLTAYLTRNPRATKFVTDYASGWIDYWHDAESQGETRTVAATKLDGSITRWDHRVRGFGFSSLFIGAMHLTGEERYRDAALRFVNAEAGQFRVGDAIAALDAVNPRKYAQQLAAWADSADLAHVTADQFGYIARQRYVKFEVTGDEQAAIEALEASLRNVRLLFDAYTLGEPQNDRIWPPDMVASVMALGDSPDMRNQLYPRHYVSYEGFSDLAAWVRRKSDTSLTVWLYNFGPTESGVVRTWRTPAGVYNVTVDGEPCEVALRRGAGMDLTLEPGRVHELTIELAMRDGSDSWQRPDAAISPSQVTWTPEGALRVVVHNLGNAPLRDVKVALVGGQGFKVAEAVIARIDPPVDLHPQHVDVTFTDVSASAQRVVIDPDGAIAELYDMNNEAVIPPRRSSP